MRNRLYLRLYAALLASAFVCLTVAGIAFRVWSRAGGLPVERVQAAGNAVSEAISGIWQPGIRARLAQIGGEFSVDVIVGDGRGPRVGFPSARAFPPPARLEPGLLHERGGPTYVVRLDDGAWAAIRAQGPYRRLRVHPFFATLVVLAVVMALGSYPIARRVARRLEALAAGVETWGQGQLEHRVATEGHDEIGRLATTFNQAAERVSALMAQQKQMLANVSHELRSPLARVRMGLELVAEEPDGARRARRVAEIHEDIVELDGLIEEILVFARADARVPSRALVEVDLARLCREEAARTGARCEIVEPGASGTSQAPSAADGRALAVGGGGRGGGGLSATLLGDEPLLRHMVRNLLENAVQHGGGLGVRLALTVPPAPPARAGLVERVAHDGAGDLTVVVEDAGPGIPEAERELVFAPFYRRARAPEVPGAGVPGGAGSARGATASGVVPARTRSASGHGVGLALVRQVARYHGGEVRYLPRAGGGSAFEVRLPRSGPSAELAPTGSASARGGVPRGAPPTDHAEA
jgi:signal transduction histidine kinase